MSTVSQSLPRAPGRRVRRPRQSLLVRLGWSALGIGMMILGLLANWMVGSALWARWGHGTTAFYVSAAIAAAAGGALYTLGFLFDGALELTRARILEFWVLWSWLCLCFRFADRLGTENASWPYYLSFLVPVVLVMRNRGRNHWGGWIPRSIAEMRVSGAGQESSENKEPRIL